MIKTGSQMKSDEEISRTDVWKMFDRIAHRYDLLNRLLSARRDVAWRKKMAALLPEKQSLSVLDLATGTGDQLLSLIEESSNIERGIGIDLSTQMLEVGKKKVAAAGLEDRLHLNVGDACKPPFSDESFDATTISFGIRNVIDVSESLSEMLRVLKPGGRSLILEFSLPSNFLLRKGYLFYFRYVLPKIGSILSGDSYAYRYLNQTVESFPYGEEFCKLMRSVGFTNVSALPLTFGIASIYSGDKPL